MDECARENDVCPHNCINTVHCHVCVFVIDVDECARENGGCPHNCTNTEGSYTCSCHDGFEDVNDDGTNCIGNDCELSL